MTEEELIKKIIDFYDNRPDKLPDSLLQILIDNIMSYKLLYNIASLRLGEIERYFIDNRININVVDKFGSGIIYHALDNLNFNKVIPYLVKQGANINQQNNCLSTPLHKAACMNQYDVIKLLLDNRASRDIENAEGKKPQDMPQVSQETQNFLISYQVSSNQDITALGKHNEYDEFYFCKIV
ncbi:MAG TPA: ankyrin repeat domain-containing protein [Rickettsia endosymbiont of Pyrocoelia pectoralis]|nr:ankyrin repeat domain-containing protein [Rickettsia endosymbiont of Pyrocoelia pectoralis]